MVDYINYYYNIFPTYVSFNNSIYSFFLNGEKYAFVPYTRGIDEINDIVKLNREMIENGSLVHEIIMNKDNLPLCLYNDINYIMLRIYVDDSKIVDINDLIFMINSSMYKGEYKSLNRTDWKRLWGVKVDYLEYEMVHYIKKYPLVNSYIDYYLGLSENAITYFKNMSYFKDAYAPIGISHKRIGYNSTLFDLYNPLNLIIDFRVRDIAEYIKDSFFKDADIKSIVNKIFTDYNFDKINLCLIFSRMLFPSYFYDEFENVVINDLNENVINNIIKKSSQYEDLLFNFISAYNLPSINWIVNIR